MDTGSPLLRSGLILGFTFGGCALRKVPFLPIDRPTICLLGGLATVLLGVLGLDEAWKQIDLGVIALLLGMMAVAGGLAEAGVYARIALALAGPARERPRAFLAAILLGAGGLAALVTNDTVCIFFAPLTIKIARAAGRRPMPFLVALALAANTGSAATLVGNPQNMIVGVEAAHDPRSRLGFAHYLLLAAPVALAGLAASWLAVSLLYRRELAGPAADSKALAPEPYDAGLARVSVAALAIAGILLVANVPLALAALVAAALLLVASRRDPRVFYGHIDVGLLVLFAGLFVVTAGARSAGAIEALRVRFAPDPRAAFPSQAAAMTVFTTAGSQIVSNVPFVLATAPWLGSLASPDGHRALLALVSTFAGNLTLLGSVANLIVAGAARQDEPMSFAEHLRAGLPVTLVQVALALGAVVLYASLGWV